MRMRCVVVVPLLNEEAHLPTFLASLDGQTRRPDLAVLVDDGSTDASPALCEDFAASRDWVTVLRRPPRPPRRDRLAEAPELAAFLWALERMEEPWAATGIPEPWDVVAKMDADLDLAPDHFVAVLAAFEADPGLGMAGAYLSVVEPDGALRTERHPPEHVRGPTRFYRRACFEAIAPIPVILGWDGADEVRARARGWRTRSLELEGRPTVHLRPTGMHDGRLRARARWGLCAYAVGAHPLGVVAAAGHQMRQRPWVLGGLAYVWGWLDARRRGVPRAPADIRAAKRAEQLRRVRSLRA
jgi:glycosyltransferase involved in cell wall biosynthesis